MSQVCILWQLIEDLSHIKTVSEAFASTHMSSQVFVVYYIFNNNSNNVNNMTSQVFVVQYRYKYSKYNKNISNRCHSFA